MAWGYTGLLLSFPAYYLKRFGQFSQPQKRSIEFIATFALELLVVGWSFKVGATVWKDAQRRLVSANVSIRLSSRLISEMMTLQFLAEPSFSDRVFFSLFGWTRYARRLAFSRRVALLKSLQSLARANNVFLGLL